MFFFIIHQLTTTALTNGNACSQSTDEQTRRARQRQVYMEEARLMELLMDEELDEERIPDEGELEGSGDDFGIRLFLAGVLEPVLTI